MKTKCLIIDSEPLARELIKSYIGKLENFEIINECSNAIKALESLREKQIDLIIIDIQMPEISGIDFLRSLKKPPKIIITTAYREFALEAFELEALDYLLKPVSFERFLKAINKYYRINRDEIKILNGPCPNPEGNDTFIYVKENKRVIKIYMKEIRYIEGLSEYVQIYTDKKKVVTKTSLVMLDEKLPSEQFLRIHKSYIISIPKIESFTANTVEIAGKELPIGRSFKTAVLSALNFSGTVSSF
jgi:DNA-binding LytR/AlgR family response regulator